jgi:hypothetical protein
MRTCGGSVATKGSGISPRDTEVLLVLSARRVHPTHRWELARAPFDPRRRGRELVMVAFHGGRVGGRCPLPALL